MQSRDEYENIKQFEPVDLSKADELAAKIKAAEEKGAVTHTIARLPKAGEVIEMRGLSYRVDFADFVRGKFTVKLICRDK